MKEPTLHEIVKIVNFALVDKILTEDDADIRFDLMGIDSMDFIAIIVAIEEEFDIEFPDEKLIVSELYSIGRIYSVLCDVFFKNR